MPTTLAPSTIALFQECPRCFWLHINKKIKRPETPFPSLPAGMDRIIKMHFDKCRASNQCPPELSQIKSVKLFPDQPLIRIWRNPTRGILWQDPNKNILHGAVDDILQKDNKLIVLDIKTRGYPVKEETKDYYQHQMDIYTFLLQKNGYETEDYAYLLFYHPDAVHADGTIIFNKEVVKVPVSTIHAEQLFNNAFTTLSGPIPDTSHSCGFCAWSKESRVDQEQN